MKEITNYGYVLKDSGEFVMAETIDMAYRLFESRQREGETERACRESMRHLSTNVFKCRQEEGDIVVVFSEGQIAERFGITTEEVEGKRLEEVLSEEYYAKVRNFYRRAFVGEDVDFEQKIEGIWFKTELRPIIGEGDGETITEVIGHSYVITPLKNIETALRKYKQRLTVAQRIGRVGVWEWNVQSGEVYWSPEMYLLYGESGGADSIRKDAFLERVHESDSDFVRERVEEIARRGVAVNFDFRVLSANGELRTLNTRGEVTEVDAEGHPLFVVGVNQDITERKRAEEEKDFLMRELNHRVKNNLYMINSLVHMKDAEIGEQVDLSDIVHQIDAIRFVHEKLDTTGKVTHINIRSYLLDLLRTVFGSFSSQTVEIEESIRDMQLRTKLAISIGLIVNETATNAVKHGFVPGREAKYSITLQPGEKHFVLRLSNTGNSFPEDIDLDNPTTLGLRLITALVTQIEGTLELEKSPNPVFSISFPVEAEDAVGTAG